MTATINSEGQVTIPAAIRERLHLKPGDVLEFDESAPFLKAEPAFDEAAMWAVIGCQKDKGEFKDMSTAQILDELRGPVALPAPTP